MNNLFVKDEDEIKVEILVAQTKEGYIYCEAKKDKKDLEKLINNDELEGKIEEYIIIFKKPNFKDMSEISNNMVNVNSENGVNFNLVGVRMAKIKNLLKKWDFKDDEGNEIPINNENIDKLNPIIAGTIGVELDKATSSGMI